MSKQDPDNPKNTAGNRQAGAVGYKRPPIARRFRKGRSGNPNGRPKGRPNFAHITRDLFNAPTRVQIGNATAHMPTGEAILRKLQADAAKGEYRALLALLDIIQMTGRTDDVSDEERERRTLKLPKSMSREEYDLVGSPARAKDRQRLLQRYQELETKGGAPAGDPERILEKQGTHRSFIASMQPPGAMLPDPPPEAIRIGLEADRLLYAGDFAQAVQLAEDAIAKAPDCDATWMRLIVAHGRMFLGHGAESRSYYLSFQSDKTISWTSWETLILQEFGKLRQAGHSHPLMAEVERHLTNEGWSLKGGPARQPKAPTVTAADREFMLMNPDDLKTGALLEREEQFEKAAGLYRRNINKSRSRLSGNPADAKAREMFDLAVERLARMAHGFVMAGRVMQAFELAEEVLAEKPDLLLAQAVRAQVLMFSGEGRQAHAIFLQHRGETDGSDRWEDLVLKDFEAHRKAGRSHALMDEIERLFGKAAASAPGPATATTLPVDDEDAELLEADDVRSGGTLLQKGRVKEALAVYLRHLDRWDTARSRNRFGITAIAHRDEAVDRICDIAVIEIQNREYKEAARLAERALAAHENSPRANICKAHALMLLGHADEARRLYERCARERLDAGRGGAQAILDDFAAIRGADLTHPLMNEIEAQIAAVQETV